MALTSTGFQAPANAREGLKPSVYDGILLVGRRECPIANIIGTENVISPIQHSWHIDTLKEPSNTPREELHELKADGQSTVQKNFNAVQIAVTEWEVSESMEKAHEYGGENPVNREKGKRAIEHAVDLEFAILGLGHDPDAKRSVFTEPLPRQQPADTPISAGIFHFLAKGETAFNQGKRGNILAFDDSLDWTGTEQDMTEEMFLSILQQTYDLGGTPKDIFVGASLKGKINAFRKNNGNTTTITNNTVPFKVDTIDTDFGTVRVHLHRFLSNRHGLGDVLIAGDFEFMKNGLFIPTNHKEFNTGRTSIGGRFRTEFCLCVKNADAFAIGVGLK